MILSPSEIFYSQNSINNKFDERCSHSFKYIGETLDDICDGRCRIDDIPRISVAKKNGKWVTADNRRLWVFKHLHRLGKCDQIYVNETSSIPWQKYTTENGGVSIPVRRNQPGGKWYLKSGVATSRPSTVSSSSSNSQLISSLSGSKIGANRDRTSVGPFTQASISIDSMTEKSCSIKAPFDGLFRGSSYQSISSLQFPTHTERVTQKRYLVCGLDFGTTYSGWAYSFKDDYDKDPTQGYVKQWRSGTGMCTEKTPTSILIKPDGKTIEAFGYEAEDKFSNLYEDDEHIHYYLFRQFKMTLYKKLGEGITRDILLEDELGKTLPAIDVFSLAIEFLSQDLKEHMESQLGNFTDVVKTMWVITVPAIWTDVAKQFMREAAEKAGLPSDNLKLVLEPEAASLCCRHLTSANIVNDNDIDNITPPPGSKYIIFDAGGGTVDITLHKIGLSRELREVKPASGADSGGTMVDKKFEELLVSIIGQEVYGRFKKTETNDYLELMREFELKKRQIRQTGGKVYISIRIPPALCDTYVSMTNRSLRQAVVASDEDITMIGDKVHIKGTSLTNMFDQSINRSISSLRDILQNEDLTQIHAIYMVGGYSQCPLLQSGLQKAFPTLNIVTPLDAGMCVLKGSLIYGHNPTIISERILRYTYGIRIRQSFDPRVHPSSKLIETDEGPYCSGIFSIHTRKNQTVHIGSKQRGQCYTSVEKFAKTIYISLYASDRVSPEFVDETGCRKIGKVTMELKKPFAMLYPSVTVYFTFSGPEIIVEAVEDATGDTITATVNFLG
ncbi:Heat shock 70 kDa protein 12A [Mactra antiquata]